jgi:hypothetical protein
MSQINLPPRNCILKRRLNKHAVGTRHVRGDRIFNSLHTRLVEPIHWKMPILDILNNENSSDHPPQEDFGDDGAYDEYNEMEFEDEEEDEIVERVNNLEEEDNGEYLDDRDEPVDDDDVNLADLMAQNSLDDMFVVSDLTKDELGKNHNHGIEPILPKVIIMVSINFLVNFCVL